MSHNFGLIVTISLQTLFICLCVFACAIRFLVLMCFGKGRGAQWLACGCIQFSNLKGHNMSLEVYYFSWCSFHNYIWVQTNCHRHICNNIIQTSVNIGVVVLNSFIMKLVNGIITHHIAITLWWTSKLRVNERQIHSNIMLIDLTINIGDL